MSKLRVVLSRVLLTVIIAVQVFGAAGISNVQASTSTKNLESVIVSGGTFNTGIKINQNYSVEMTFSLSSLNQYKNIYIANGAKYDVYKLRYEANQGLFAAHGWYNQKIYTPKVNEDITISNKKNVFYVNGNKAVTETYQSIESIYTLKFGDMAGNIKAFKVWNESGVLVASYIPVLDAVGKACMYDTVGNKYVYYSGTCKAGKAAANTTQQSTQENKTSANKADVNNSVVNNTEINKAETSKADADKLAGVQCAEALKLSGGLFNSGLTINQDYSVEMVFSLDNTTQYKDLYNAAGTKYSVYKLRNEAGNGLYAEHGWYKQKIYTPKENEKITLLQKKNITYVNGKQAVKMTLQELSSIYTLKFGDFKGTIESFKVWDASGKLAGEYLPAIDETGKACMYDTVSKKYIKYSGTCSAVGAKEDGAEPKEETKNDTVQNTTSNFVASTQAGSAKSEARKAVYDIAKDSLVNNNASTKSIEKYNMTQEEVKEIIAEVRNDYFLEANASTSIICLGGTAEKCTSIYMIRADKEYTSQVNKLKTVRDNILSKVEPGMTDMDKVLLAHEYIINNCEYSTTGTGYYTTIGSLVYGKASCAGYTKGMMFLLHYMNIETRFVESKAMDHGWLYVKIDGEWYHIDATWDDTRKGSDGSGMHKFFIRNDKEMLNISSGRHYDWKLRDGNFTSTSTKYTNWFVHNVAGTMHYYKGMWYYVDINTGAIKASTIEGTNTKTIIDKLTVSGISKIYSISSDGVMKYCANGKTYTKAL